MDFLLPFYCVLQSHANTIWVINNTYVILDFILKFCRFFLQNMTSLKLVMEQLVIVLAVTQSVSSVSGCMECVDKAQLDWPSSTFHISFPV